MATPENKFRGLTEAAGPMPLEIAGFCAEIREKLGRKAYLLDNYLSLLALRLSAFDPARVVHIGMDAFERLYNICRITITEDSPGLPFADKVRRVIAEHPLEYDDHYSRAGLYSYMLAEEYFVAELPELFVKLEDSERKLVDIERMNELRVDMTSICGIEIMDKLDEEIRATWQPVSPMRLLKHGYIHQMLCNMALRDEETQKTRVTLALDEAEKDSKS